MDDSKRRDSNASDKSEEGDTKRTNQFSFVERATQTMNNALKVKMMLTMLVMMIARSELAEQRHAD